MGRRGDAGRGDTETRDAGTRGEETRGEYKDVAGCELKIQGVGCGG
jgi:hypothetical protein